MLLMKLFGMMFHCAMSLDLSVVQTTFMSCLAWDLLEMGGFLLKYKWAAPEERGNTDERRLDLARID
jgi:hypothetical protein